MQVATYIAAWNMAVERGERDPHAVATLAVDETQGVYSKVGRPNWARSTPGRIAFTFSQFRIMNVELLKRMASRGGAAGKKGAVIYLALLILAAGMNGLPFMDDIDDLIDSLGQWLGHDTNMKRDKRKWAHAVLGRALGDVALYGTSTLTPSDYGGRLGFAKMTPASGALKPSNTGRRMNEALELGGPVVSGLGKQVMDSYEAARVGRYGKAATALAPSGIKNAAAGLEMARTGVATDALGRNKVAATRPCRPRRKTIWRN
jgi:hypothetical protein